MLKEGNFIELLDHSKYLILSKIVDGKNTYLLLMNKEDISDSRVCLVQGEDITEVEDKKEIDKLTLQFFQKIIDSDKEKNN